MFATKYYVPGLNMALIVSFVVGRSGMFGNSAMTGARIRRSEPMPFRPTATGTMRFT